MPKKIAPPHKKHKSVYELKWSCVVKIMCVCAVYHVDYQNNTAHKFDGRFVNCHEWMRSSVQYVLISFLLLMCRKSTWTKKKHTHTVEREKTNYLETQNGWTGASGCRTQSFRLFVLSLLYDSTVNFNEPSEIRVLNKNERTNEQEKK